MAALHRYRVCNGARVWFAPGNGGYMRQFIYELPDLSESYVAIRGTSWEALDRELSKGLLTRRHIDEEPENWDENIGIRLVREGMCMSSD